MEDEIVTFNESAFLKPCPFCGSEAVYFEDVRFRDIPGELWMVYGAKCSNIDCIMNQDQKFYRNKCEARRAWNKRVNDDMIYVPDER